MSVSPPSPLTPDEANWARISDTEDLREVRDHLARFPDSLTMPAARRLLEDLVWRDILIAPTEDKLNVFTDEFPDGRHFAEAMSLLEQLISHGLPTRIASNSVRPARPVKVEDAGEDAAHTPKTEPPVTDLAPQSPPLPPDQAAWSRIRDTDSKQDLRGHISAFPDSDTVHAARAKLEELAWRDLRAAATADELEKFLEEFPDSAHADAANQLLLLLRSSAAWSRAVEAGLRADLEDFIRKFPASDRTAEAERMLARLAAAEAAAAMESPPLHPMPEPDVGHPAGSEPAAEPQHKALPEFAASTPAGDPPTDGLDPSARSDPKPDPEAQSKNEPRAKRSRAGLAVTALLLLLLLAGIVAVVLDFDPFGQIPSTPQVSTQAPAISTPAQPPSLAYVPAPDGSAIDARLKREKVGRSRLEIAVVWNGGEDVDLSIDCPGGIIHRDAKTGCRGSFGRDAISEGEAVEYAVWTAPPSGAYNVRVTLAGGSRQRIHYRLRIRKDGNVQSFDGVLSPGDQRNQAFRFP